MSTVKKTYFVVFFTVYRLYTHIELDQSGSMWVLVPLNFYMHKGLPSIYKQVYREASSLRHIIHVNQDVDDDNS